MSPIILIIVLCALSVFLLFALIQAVRGPRLADRIVGINMTGSLSTAAIAVLSIYFHQSWLLDVCLIYCLISFLSIVVLAKIKIAAYQQKERDEDD